MRWTSLSVFSAAALLNERSLFSTSSRLDIGGSAFGASSDPLAQEPVSVPLILIPFCPKGRQGEGVSLGHLLLEGGSLGRARRGGHF